MDRFWDLLERNTLASSIIAAGLVGTACYIWASGQTAPPALESALALVLGYFLGAKVEYAARRSR